MVHKSLLHDRLSLIFNLACRHGRYYPSILNFDCSNILTKGFMKVTFENVHEICKHQLGQHESLFLSRKVNFCY